MCCTQIVPARYYAEFPPGFDGFPLLYVSTIFSLMMIALLSMEWIWRLAWSFVERPSNFKHPVAAVRAILIFLLLGSMMRVGPNLVWMTLWGDMSPGVRFWWFRVDNFMDTVSFLPFSLAWLVGYLGGPMIVHQLVRNPIPLHLWPTPRQVMRPLKIGVAVMVIALAVVYVR